MKKAIDYLIEWTENINWKNHLLNNVLQNIEIDIEAITLEVIDIITNNKVVNLITSPTENTRQESQLYIKEIKSPVNINALCPEAGCELGKNLNVFYGENGSGKSSYVKVFRKLADNFYTNEKNLNIMSNIYTTEKTSDVQTITMCYSCDENDGLLQCIDINTKNSVLSKINVFDSSSVTPLINTDLTFSVLPQGLNYFSKLTDLIDCIKVKLQEIVSTNTIEQNKIFSDSSFSIISEDISLITTNVPSVDKLDGFIKTNYLLHEDFDIKIETIENTVRELQSTNTVELIKNISTQKAKLEALKRSFELLSSKVNSVNINAVNSFIEQYDELLVREDKHNVEFGKRIKHIAVNNEWTNFITSAREYYMSIGVELPKEKSPCIFCGQTLEKEQIDLIESCLKHINSETNQIKNEINKRIQDYFIPEISVVFLAEDEKLFSEDKSCLVEKLKTTINLVEKNKKIFTQNIKDKKKIPAECVINFEEIIGSITNEILEIEGRLTTLGKSNQEINEHLLKLTNDKTSLLRVKKINESKKLFENWYEYKTKIDSLNKIKSRFTTNVLSTKAKDAFNEIVAGDYISTFNSYCENLGVPNVNISLASKKGQTQRGKFVVRENIKVTDIMSEGEQKAIALAEFVTDLKVRKNNCTTLFDDPVTSFDYKRAEKIADIIYQISNERQVIVFTHNIMFYYYLYNCCAKENNKENKFYKIDQYDRDNKGLISISAEGRLENLNEVTKKIKNYAQKISSKICIGDDLEQTLKSTYSDIRTWCELIVEEGFLKKIIRRYEPNIMFKPISKINSEFVDYIPAVSDLFDKSCRYMLGHSQPSETQNVKASREEFYIDYKFIMDLYEKYKN